MEKLVSNDEKDLIEIFKVISWLDDKRWKHKIRNAFVEKILETDELRPAQKILVHWLIYITDRGKRADILWEKSTPKIKKLVARYFSEDLVEKEQVTELCEKYEEENKIQAFPADLESIKRTLILLLDYDKDIIYFMTRKLSKWARKYPEDFCPRIAFSLYLLSYKDVGSILYKIKKESRSKKTKDLSKKMEEAKGLLTDDTKFEKEFQKWYKDKKWHKRTWAALRDYKKFRKLSEKFIEGIKDEATLEVWKKDFSTQLELPGDIWNTRFFANCIKPIAENMKVSLRGKKTPKVVRELWDKIKSKCPESYPEQFDITFDFTPRMCNRRLCDVCPLGPNGAELICIPTRDKYCPVALVSCGYIVECGENQDRCPINKSIGKGTCKMDRSK